MRHPIRTLYLLVSTSRVLITALAQSSVLESSPSVSYLRHIQLSRGLDEEWNNTGHIYTSSYASEYEHYSEEIQLSIPQAIPYKRVPRHFVHLKPRGSRTTLPLGLNGELLFTSASKTTGVLPNELTPSTTILAGCHLLVLSGLSLCCVFTSVKAKLNLFRWSFAATFRATVAAGWIFVRSLVTVISWYWDVIVWVDESLEYVLPWLVAISSSVSLHLEQIRQGLNAREGKWITQECIKRKKQNPRAGVYRQAGQRAATRLFWDRAHDYVQHLYLPEEQYDPVRHMHDPRHFNHLKKIGAGAFGSIYLVEHRITGKNMAMKTLLRRENSNEEIGLEIRALLRLQESAWYPKLLSTFMDPLNFYILMPFYEHGDLYSVINSCGGCLSRDLAKFYLAELIVAIQGLHKAGIMHRDLKPDNILFDEEGHAIIADFGVAQVFITDEQEDAFLADEYPLWEEMKRLDDDGFPLLTPSIDNPHTIKGVAGTPFYAAPEVLASEEYSYGVDYYSLAIVYHEMVTGYVPIQCGPCRPGESEPTISLDLGRKDVHLQPISVSDYDFLSHMLDENPYLRPTVRQMKDHPVLAGIDWVRLSQRQGPVPPASGLRKRVPISPGFERCLTMISSKESL